MLSVKLVAILPSRLPGKPVVWRGLPPPKMKLEIVVEPPENCYWEWINLENIDKLDIYQISTNITGMQALYTSGKSRQIGQSSDDSDLFWAGDGQSFRDAFVLNQILQSLRGNARNGSGTTEVL